MRLHDFESMKKTWNTIWSRSVQSNLRELWSGPNWWRKRCSLNIDTYRCNDGRGNPNRTSELLQPNSTVRFWFFSINTYILYIHIYRERDLCMHLCIHAFMHLCIHVSVHLCICASMCLCICASMHICICFCRMSQGRAKRGRRF